MKILIFGGFLGAGKTTLMNKALRGLLGKREGLVAVIENEVGEFGVDEKLVGECGVSVTPLSGGCVCCQITGSLIGAVDQIEREIGPDYIVVELTGLALMENVREVFQKYSAGNPEVFAFSVVDATRWEKMIGAMRPFMEKQLGGADAVIISKTDVKGFDENALGQLREIVGPVEVLKIAASQITDDEFWEVLQAVMARKEVS